MNKTYFTADHHFGHRGVIGMCQRPFADVAEMDEALVHAWNSRVGHRDEVWHLGDFAMGASPERCQALFNRLNGRKWLVRGNHDKAQVTELQWQGVFDLARITVEGQRLVLCHYAMRSWPQVWRGSLHLYGHTHGTLPPTRQSCDVGVDAWAYRPATLEEIRERLATVADEPEEIRLARAGEAEEE